MKKLKLSISLFAFIALLFVNCHHSDVVQPSEKAIDLDQLATELAKDEDFGRLKLLGDDMAEYRKSWFFSLSTKMKKEVIKAYSKKGTPEQKDTLRKLFNKDEKAIQFFTEFALLAHTLHIKFAILRTLNNNKCVNLLKSASSNYEKIASKVARVEVDCDDNYVVCSSDAFWTAVSAIGDCVSDSFDNAAPNGDVSGADIQQCWSEAYVDYDLTMDGCFGSYTTCFY